MINKNTLDRIKDLNFPPLSEESINNLETRLEVRFSQDFKCLSSLASLEYFQTFNVNNLEGESQHSVLGDTLRLRKDILLPRNILFLSEDDASLLLMKCLGDREEIVWIAIEDFENYCEGKPLIYDPLIFPTFADFFEHLLEEEEKIRQSS